MPDLQTDGQSPPALCLAHSADIQALHVSQSRSNQRHTEQMISVHSTVSRIETKVDRILEGISIGAIVPARPPESPRRPLPSLGWDIDEPTHPGDADSASTWAHRARMTAELAEREATARAGAEVRLIEARSHARKATIAAVAGAIVAVIGALAALLPRVFGG